MSIPKYTLPVIVFAQFCCTSLWFAGNGIIDDLIQSFGLSSDALGHLTSAVQLGFIFGTLVFAFLSIADRFSPSKVFMVCGLVGAACNTLIITGDQHIESLLSIRFITGFCLAGIYPVGMKIAADYYNKGLGKSLGYLVGALVLGTAFPHLIKSIDSKLSWELIIIATSSLAALGGLLIYFLIPDGPYRKSAQAINLSAINQVFKNHKFRSAAMGYFGHMWELYAFWTFTPVLINAYCVSFDIDMNISLWSFIIIGIGAISCIAGGYLSVIYGAKKVAISALTVSGVCCLLIPFAFLLPEYLFLLFLTIWGISVIMDSPMLSTLVAHNAEPQIKGTALTIVNCIGFSITIVSIQLINFLSTGTDIRYFLLLLAIGPLIGVLNLRKG
jgi:MFS family permease